MNNRLTDQIASITVDSDSKKVLITTKDMIWKQLNRDNKKIEKSFDKLFKKEIDSLSEVFGEISGIVLNGCRIGNELQNECGVLLLNSLNTYVAAIQLFRSGHRLSPLMLMRSIVEILCVVNHLTIRPNDLEAFRTGKLKSTRCVTTAKQVFPPIGELYGHLSNTVTHVAELHRNINPISEYKTMDEAVKSNFGFLRLSIWLTYVTAELVFVDLIHEAKYWKEYERKGYSFSPSEETKKWMDQFLEEGLDDIAT